MMPDAKACPSCGLPSARVPCSLCEAAGALLDPSAGARLGALEGATDRSRVLLSFLRGGRLWEDEGADRVIAWLLRHEPTIVFLRWLAEDSWYGDSALSLLASREDPQELARCLLRAPLWLARWGQADQDRSHPLVRTWSVHPKRLYALGFRLGSCGVDQRRERDHARFIGAFSDVWGWLALLAMRAGRRRPTRGAWRPSAAQLDGANHWRRWPLARLEDDGVLVCGLCAEPLPASGVCAFCGTDPEEEAPAVLPLADLLAEREPCPMCGLDLTSRALPAACGCCGTRLAWSGGRPSPRT